MGVRTPGNDIMPVDSFGMMPNGRPYHTEMQFNPLKPVKLYVARKNEPSELEIEYVFNTVSLDKLPNVHSAALGPMLSPFQIGGVMLQPLSSEFASQFGHAEYLEDKSDELVFVVVSAVPGSPEWNVLHITPGSLCTKVNHVKFDKQPNLTGNTPKDAIETAMKNAVNDECVNETFETRDTKTGKMQEVCQMHLLTPPQQTQQMTLQDQFQSCVKL